MLRFAVISGVTLALLGLVFYFVVWHAQPPAIAAADDPASSAPVRVVTTQSSSNMVGPGMKPWVENFENGKLTSKFTAAEYTPQKDGSFLVDHPVSIFYLDKGQIMKVTGDSGQVNCDTSGPKTAGGSSTGLFAGPTSSPKNGSLHHVRVELFPSESDPLPAQTMETENIHFDNETLPTMFTESYVDSQGNTVPADQVPVTVRGQEYEFDGYGLTLVWNAQKRLENLEIYHGKRLEIINPGKLSLPGMTPAEPVKPAARVQAQTPVLRYSEEPDRVPGNPALRSTSEPASEMSEASESSPFDNFLASTNSADISLLPKPQVHAVDPPLPYRAIFNDNIRITQASRTMAIADLMTVDFLQGHNRAAASASSAATASESAAPQSSANQSFSPPALASTEAAAAKPPSTKPSNGPITIYWTGPLVVTPLKSEPMLPLSAGQSVMRLIGTPVVLTPEGSTVTAASATYRSPDGAVKLEHSGQVPLVKLSQTKGMTLSTGSIDYDPAAEIATLTGPSAMQVPVEKKQMDVSWSEQGLLHIIRQPGQPNGVDHVDLIGDVAVSHPTFALNSRELKLDLDLVPKKGSTDADEQLRQLTAIDGVICQLMHPGKPMQEIDTDQLVIRTEPSADHHSVVPREVIADGNVTAFDPDQSIKAGHLDALLLAKAGPATKPSPDQATQAVDLESLHASDNVHARLKNGATADTDQLRIQTTDGQQIVDLWGPRGAVLSSKDGSWLTGPVVHLIPATSQIKVEGAGMMETIRAGSTARPVNSPPNNSPPRPIDVTWADSMSLDGKTNIADVVGNVTVRNTDAIGTASTLSGDIAHLDLVDMPKNLKQPAATQPDAMTGKQLKKLTLSGNVVGRSELNDSAGHPLRRGNLYGNTLIYTAADGTAVIPGPGKLFVENHQPDKGQAPSPRTGAPQEGLPQGNSKGAMAIQWNQQLVYDQTTDKITIDGNTRVGFEQENKSSKPAAPMQLDSDRLIVTLSKTLPPGTHVKSGDQSKMQLSHMQSIGQVHFVANGINLYCNTMDYDPVSSIMTLRGSPQQPGRAMDARQSVTGSFDELRYDTAAEEVIDGQNIQGSIQQ